MSRAMRRETFNGVRTKIPGGAVDGAEPLPLHAWREVHDFGALVAQDHYFSEKFPSSKVRHENGRRIRVKK